MTMMSPKLTTLKIVKKKTSLYYWVSLGDIIVVVRATNDNEYSNFSIRVLVISTLGPNVHFDL